ncbi:MULTISPECIES: FecR family protein [unclassified Flavobacterium]|uniref:FecR family protein n=1 Tax=unclassified Flavobacterium TaxID=196869 RepID=UPI001F142BB5|nr:MULTISPECIES: FecR domain-containing protein [unclassified Flavobacterium]UMY65613.1 FecR domain-containing protein [Flavobacterium sp. HJ-32-4]
MEKEHDLAKWLAGEMTGDELREFEKSEGFATYQRIAAHSERLQLPDFDTSDMLQRITSREKKTAPVVRPLWRRAGWQIAAILVIGLGIWLGLPNEKPTVYVADAGMQKSFRLPDGSEVTLNAGSEASYLKGDWDDNREVSLTGEAFFHVAKGRKFEVHTDQGTVTVLGTQFDVRSRGQRFEVECFEGRVDVKTPTSHTIITKGQIVAFEKGQPLEVAPQSSAQPSWMHGELAFRAENLDQVVAELQRHFNIRIDLRSNAATERFTGVVPGDDPLVALHLIARTYKLQIRQASAKAFILDAME